MMYKAIFSLAYYGLMRIGELTVSSNDEHTAKAVNVQIGQNKNKILIVLYSSKTHGKESKPQKIKISEAPANSKPVTKFFCPFKLVRAYLNIRGGYHSKSEPFFIFSDGSPVEASHVRWTLRNIFKCLNLDSSLYDCHSFRIGRTTDLFKCGYPVQVIQQVGRWKSNAVYKYIKL